MSADWNALQNFLTGAVKFVGSKRTDFARRLIEIERALTAIRQSFESRVIPRDQAYEMATLVAVGQSDLGGVIHIPHAASLFRERLPKIGMLMRAADVLIDGRERDEMTRELAARNFDYVLSPGGDSSQEFRELFEEIDRAKGELRAIASALSKGKY